MTSLQGMPVIPSTGFGRIRWYAAYTSPRHEKRVAEHLAGRSVDHFLPTYNSKRNWHDRQKSVELPLFPGYIFVRIDLTDRLRVLGVPGIIHLVSFNRLPAPLSDQEIESMRIGLAQVAHARPHPYSNIGVGRRVRIIDGPFSGLEGTLIRRKGNLHVILSVDLIQRSLLVDIEASSFEFQVPPSR
jgi:transcription antitermination factor NusG